MFLLLLLRSMQRLSQYLQRSDHYCVRNYSLLTYRTTTTDIEEMDICSACGEEAVKEDTENGQTLRVCVVCGVMDNDHQELTSENQFQGTTVTDGRGHGPDAQRNWMREASSSAQQNKKLGTKLITSIGNQLKVGEDVTAAACHLYEKVYDTQLHCTNMDSKKAMCLACLYASARINKVPLNVRTIGFFLNIKDSAKKFASALKCLKAIHDVHLPAQDIESETWGMLSQSDLPNEVVKTTQQLMLIMQRAMITTGRHSISSVVPCAYYAFKASDLFTNKNLNFKAFCRKFGFKQSLKYVCKSEIENTLKAMAKELPWVKVSGADLNHVEMYVTDIIKYQSSLLAEAIKTAVNQIDEQCDEKKDSLEISKEPGCIFRKFRKKELKKKNENDRDFGSPMKKKSKISKSEDNAGNSSGLESLDLGSDDDTDLYILPSHEVMLKKEVNKKFNRHMSEDESVEGEKHALDNKVSNIQTANRNKENDCDASHDDDVDDEDKSDDYDTDNDVDEAKKYLLKRQCDGTANIYPEEDSD